MIKIENMTFAYHKGFPVLEDISLTMKKGECVGIIGCNGAGKSTLLKLLVGLATDYQGAIKVDGLEATKENMGKIRKKVGYIFQDSESQMFMPTVYEDVAFGPINEGLSKEEVENRVTDALAQMGIADLRDRHLYRISGGQKKLASIAAILAMQPEILLMDEPTITLDPKNRRNLIHKIQNLPVTRLIASHDLDMILDTCDRVVLLGEKKIIKVGAVGEILADEKLLEEYGLELPLSMLHRNP